MAGRRYDDVVSTYDDRREYVSSRGGRRVYDDEIEFRRVTPTMVRERERESNTPAFMRDDYVRTSAGPMVLRQRDREDFDYAPRRRRSPSPEPARKVEKEEIIINRREDSHSRPSPPRSVVDRPRDVEREEIIIRRDERDSDRRLPPPREREREREEIIIRRDESQRPHKHVSPPASHARDEIIIRRDEKESDRRTRFFDDDDMVSVRRSDFDRRTTRSEVDREEIIIRREEADRGRDYDDYTLARPKSHERARSRVRRSSDESNKEIIIRRDETRGRSGERERQEIIIRKSSRSRSRSPSISAPSIPAPAPVPEPQVIHAPTIHQEVITHHRHIDHGYEVQIPTRPRVIERPPSPPSPPSSAPIAPSVRDRSEERIQINRSQTRNGRTENEEIIIDRQESSGRAKSVGRLSPPRDYYDPPPRRDYRPYDREVQEEADYYNAKALERSYVGEGYHGSTRDWAIVDVPPGTHRVRMDGAGGGAQEITWQRYNGVRRSKFMPDGADDGHGSEVGRPLPPPIMHDHRHHMPHSGDIGRRYGRERDPTEGLWTEITKDLVVKEAIQEMGYEFEETDDFYYIIAYLRYEDVARLVGLSEDIRKERRMRAKEMEWENRVLPPKHEHKTTLAIEAAPPRSRPEWEKEEERYIEREILYRGGRPPPPPTWRR